MTKKYKVVFFGTPDFSVSSLKVLADHNSIEMVNIISMPDRPAGRGKKLQSPAVISFAKENQLPFFQTSNINKEVEFLDSLEAQDIDFFVVIAFAQFLGKRLLDIPRLGAFNIHTSLLPKYRGAAPIQYALLNGDEYTGVSIQKMVKKMDAGDIVYEHKVPIDLDETCDLLFKKLEKEAAHGLETFINNLISSNEEISYKKQDEENVSFAPTIDKKDGLIDPFHFSSDQIYNRFRAYYPWPGTFLFINENTRLKIKKLIPSDKEIAPGTFLIDSSNLYLGTKSGSIQLLEVQLDGKKAVSDKDFINTLKSKQSDLILDRSPYA